MELSPRLYHWFIRPKWLTKLYFKDAVSSNIDMDNRFVLDFGCGIGSSSILFKPDSYIGVDPDYKRIAYARYLYPEYRFYTFTGYNLPIDNNSVDYILALSVLHHISSQDLSVYLNEFNRILKSKGKILAIEPCLFTNSFFNNGFMKFWDNGKYILSLDGYLEIFNKHCYHVDILKCYKQAFLYNKLSFLATPY